MIPEYLSSGNASPSGKQGGFNRDLADIFGEIRALRPVETETSGWNFSGMFNQEFQAILEQFFVESQQNNHQRQNNSLIQVVQAEGTTVYAAGINRSRSEVASGAILMELPPNIVVRITESQRGLLVQNLGSLLVDVEAIVDWLSSAGSDDLPSSC